MERKFKSSFKQFFYFATKYLKAINEGEYNPFTAKVIFNRSTITNDVELIDAVNKSVGVISNKTSIAHHPWVDDVELELQQKNEENEEEMKVYSKFSLDGGMNEE